MNRSSEDIENWAKRKDPDFQAARYQTVLRSSCSSCRPDSSRLCRLCAPRCVRVLDIFIRATENRLQRRGKR